MKISLWETESQHRYKSRSYKTQTDLYPHPVLLSMGTRDEIIHLEFLEPLKSQPKSKYFLTWNKYFPYPGLMSIFELPPNNTQDSQMTDMKDSRNLTLGKYIKHIRHRQFNLNEYLIILNRSLAIRLGKPWLKQDLVYPYSRKLPC